jgi:hypothetical protein
MHRALAVNPVSFSAISKTERKAIGPASIRAVIQWTVTPWTRSPL